MEHGGLDTLAALCGGASKAYTDEAENEKAAQPTGNQAQNTSSSGPVAAPPAVPSVATATSTQAPGQSTTMSQEAQPAPVVMQVDPSMQQWQALASAAAFGSFPNPAASAAFASIFQAPAQKPTVIQQSPLPPVDPNTYMQQFAYYQYLAAAQAQHMAAQNSQQIAPQPPTQSPTPSHAVAPYMYEGHPVAPRHAVVSDSSQRMSASPPQQHAFYSTQQVIPGPSAPSSKPTPASPQMSMQPPLPPSQSTPVQTSPSIKAVLGAAPAVAPRPAGSSPTRIFPLPKPIEAPIAQRPTQENPRIVHPPDGKKQLKRAANRRSAQLSRKRKKLYIEELKEENDELRRKEQILMSIPDLIVVFDSAGKLWFVSQSVNRFLDFLPEELEGTSFWNRLCEESVRLLKAAFMDALAARNVDTDTAPLGSGVWELRLLDKDGSHKVVTLNGVVHFSGEAPECVCSIRPRDNKPYVGHAPSTGQSTSCAITQASINSAIKPHQSVIARTGSGSGGSCRLASSDTRAKAEQRAAGDNGRLISDGDSGSVISESGSE